MFVHQIVWDRPEDPDGNYRDITSSGYTVEDVEEILMDHRNEASYEPGTSLRGVTRGTTSTGKSLAVIWAVECGNPLHIYPVRVIRV
jgi:hypothetical protein